MQLKNIKKIILEVRDEKLKPISRLVNDFQIDAHSSIEAIIGKEVLNGILLKNENLTLAQPTYIKHKLGRMPRGFFVVNCVGDYCITLKRGDVDSNYITLYPQVFTDWIRYTPTLTNFSATNSDWFYRFCGDSIDVRGVCRDLTVTGEMKSSIPTSLAIDFTRLPYGWSKIGDCDAFDSNLSVHFGGNVENDNSHATNFHFTDVRGIFGNYDATHPMTWAANDELKVNINSLPVKNLPIHASIWVF